ncbi:MAG: cytochrome bc complex cytochrome b subunit [Candidatus Omnitrophica bacterium]|nr:cytochrome bc complex cytochrome b subunit [Candidatus Omnitrophota bacterium]MCA9414908.1 cytochrome bc complex cytochrome b subunit [Candidatus Omnitrophota bacterium]MCA9435339.1 cytochrome bc complex cytochrome b subunit [Candidatus Omnitrophota bacterium]MCA9442894.1 cytochrome bc complex cytochrome b subunit [Candidatus Omnitrophota bacterium]MCA9448892.1 cytochrome bc complex cytochrome b subunit [Candidatus Omnitrophota bacterium]
MPKSSSRALESPPPSKVWTFLDERLGLSEILEIARHKRVPQHTQSFWYYWGGISLFFFLIQAISGVLLLVYYRPGVDAFDSVRRITYDIDFGWLIRSAHSWSANLMIVAVFVHMFSVFFMKAYRAPREFGWWSGLVLLGLAMTFGFSGYLLPMDELAYFATKVGLDIPTSIPVIGPIMGDLIRGGPDVNENTIQRFFALHVVILPALFVPVLMFHLFLVQKHGNAVPPSEEAKPESERSSIPFFPNFFAKDLAMWLIALNVLALLASLYPWDLGPQADPLAPAPQGIHPEWYFMVPFQVLKVFGNWFPGLTGEIMGMALFTLGGLIWAVIPLYDMNNKNAARARTATWIGFVVLATVIVFTIWGYSAL